MEYFTSDTHFWHSNVIRYCDRPFALMLDRSLDAPTKHPEWKGGDDQGRNKHIPVDVDAMNRTMVQNWNARVGPRDTVYHLGDFAMGPSNHLEPTRKKLNGRIILVRGNHDRSTSRMLEAGFDEVHEALTIERDGLKIYMRHHPLDYRQRWPDGVDVMLCGHVHELWRRKRWKSRPEVDMINVGVDVRDFRPTTLQELLVTESVVVSAEDPST